MPAPLPDAIACTLNDVIGLIYHTTNKFTRRYGGDFETNLSDAFYYFMQTFDHNPQRSGYSTYLRMKIWYGLLEEIRGNIRFRKAAILVPAPQETDECNHWFANFREQLSNDANYVIELIFEGNWYIPNNTQGTFEIRVVLKSQLRRLGWAGGRILESFAEIREVLNG